MRLGSATDGDVVQNVNNGSFYRFERVERGKARIRPLERFPNGRLLPKPVDTLVDAGLTVARVGPWHEGMAVEGKPTHARPHYEAELRITLGKLAILEAEYELLPVGGTGKQSRGSHMNKLNNARARIETLSLGLADPDGAEVERAAPPELDPRFRRRDVVLLPSGQPGQITGFRKVGASRYATVRTRTVDCGVPVEVLRPWSDSQLCTL